MAGGGGVGGVYVIQNSEKDDKNLRKGLVEIGTVE